MAAIVPFSQDPDYSDIFPIPQDDGLRPLAQITYTPTYQDSTAYLRAIAQAQEFSERTLAITERVILGNPAHYTAWQIRAETFIRLGDKAKAWKEIRGFLNDTARKYEKNYQIWRYREVLVDWLGECEGELEFTEELLGDDSKNYHVWSYRQWLVKRFGLWDEDLKLVERLIDEDLRNNSAWNHRYYNLFGGGRTEGPALYSREIQYAKSMIMQAPQNASSWAYLRGVLDKLPHATTLGEESFCLQLVPEDDYKGAVSSPALELLVEIWASKGEMDKVNKGLDALEHLEPIRKGYWKYKRGKLTTSTNEAGSTVPVVSGVSVSA